MHDLRKQRVRCTPPCKTCLYTCIHVWGRKAARVNEADRRHVFVRGPTPPISDHIDHGPRRPRLERLHQAPTTSTTRPRCNDDHREEQRYDNRDHRHDDRSENSRTGQLHRHRSDFYPKISTLLIFIFNIIFIMMFFHNILVMIVLQIMFVHVYNLKYNIQLYLMQILDQSC